jgi:hypothetical protein
MCADAGTDTFDMMWIDSSVRTNQLTGTLPTELGMMTVMENL